MLFRSLDSVARALDVQYIVSGSIAESRGRLRVHVEIADPTGAVLQDTTFERPMGEIFALIDDIGGEIATFVRDRTGHDIRIGRRRAQMSNLEAWKYVLLAEERRAAFQPLTHAGDLAGAARALLEADSLLARAQTLERTSAQPALLRGWLARDRALLTRMLFREAPPTTKMQRVLREGIRHAEDALRREPQNAECLELRGALRYELAGWLAPADSAARRTLLTAAEQDLRAAVAANPLRARAWNYLSRLHLDAGRFAESRIAALRAYTADAYLSDIHEVIFRLFRTSFELGDDAEAARWCEEVRRRFAESAAHAQCALLLMAWGDDPRPDPDQAWQLVARPEETDPPQLRQTVRPMLHLLAAATLARAGLRDSAHAVIRRTRIAGPDSPTLAYHEAAARALLGENDAALALLTAYLRSPAPRWPLRSRMLAPLRTDPRYRQLISTVPG